ncbi:copper-binding protein [uncultured Aquincola sp.]
MTMVFRAREPLLLQGLKPGDRVRFRAEKVEGGYAVTAITPLAMAP